MRLRYFNYIVYSVLAIFLSANAKSQLCPDNMDFEHGDFTNWICQTGQVAVGPGGLNTITWNAGTTPVATRHTIIDASIPAFDQFGFFPQSCPNGSLFSVKLGNTTTGSQAESVSYTYTIPAATTVFSIFYHYAVVLQNPNHGPEEQPRFRARIIDLSTNSPLPCVSFDFTASSSLPGFRVSPVNPQVLYKGWTPVTLNLAGYAGRTIMLEFITSDCTQGGHFGYAYLDVNTACNGVIAGSTICIGDNTITLTAPYGFQSYEWYSDVTYSTILSTTQSLTLSPPPTVGSVFPVIVDPFPGFGCKDTLFAVISIAPKPASDAGPDVSICQGQSVQIGGPGLGVGFTYEWTPSTDVSNPIVPDPTVWNFNDPSLPPKEFIIKTTDLLTGCYAYDTTYVSVYNVDTAIRITGKGEYCIGDPSPGVLSVSASVSAIQWYDASGPIAGATGYNFFPTVPGDYWAQVTQFGCLDSTYKLPIKIHPLPKAIFTPIVDTGCVTSNSRVFTNASTVADGSDMTYVWKFSDGDILTTEHATKTFTYLGLHNIEMVTTTAYGCKDSTTGVVRIFPNGVPDFTWDSICVDRPMLFKNLSNENSSPLVKYNWNFNNGGPNSTLKDPLPVTYTLPGILDVVLEMVNIGCENDPKSITKTVWSNRPAPGIRYRDWTIPLGSAKYLHVRDSIGNIYNWKPHKQLSSYTTQYTEFYAATDDVKYLIDITDQHTCVTTDTMQMLVLKKPGYYLPTAFTPNGDGLNDVLRPYLVGMKALKQFAVYNRWGQKIYITLREGEGWNGKISDKDQEPGVYVWILQYIDNDNKTITAKGVVTLIR